MMIGSSHTTGTYTIYNPDGSKDIYGPGRRNNVRVDARGVTVWDGKERETPIRRIPAPEAGASSRTSSSSSSSSSSFPWNFQMKNNGFTIMTSVIHGEDYRKKPKKKERKSEPSYGNLRDTEADSFRQAQRDRERERAPEDTRPRLPIFDTNEARLGAMFGSQRASQLAPLLPSAVEREAVGRRDSVSFPESVPVAVDDSPTPLKTAAAAAVDPKKRK